MIVTLITPPSGFLLDERVFPALGILKVGASLEQAGHQVDHLDLAGVADYEAVVRAHCGITGSRVFALTATTPQIPAAMKIVKVIKEVLPDAHNILGGPHATLVHAAARQEAKRGQGEGRAHRALGELTSQFDCVVAGDGELAVHIALVRRGLVDADDPKSEWWLTSQGFTESPWPNRKLIDLSTYHYSIDEVPATTLINQLGCPMKCQFCSGRSSPMLRQMRLRDANNAVSELVHVYETYGLRGCFFLDDELNINRQMLPLMQVLKQAAERLGIEWRLRGFIKSELFTDEQAAAMYAAGFRVILVGFESGDDRILRNIQKNATRDDNSRAMDIATRNGLKVKALMSLGHAGESEQSVLATRDWLLEVKPFDFDLTVIQPYPGSPYFDDATQVTSGIYRYTASKSGDHLYMLDVDFNEEAQYYKGAVGSYVSYVWTDYLNRERLVELRDQVENDVRAKLNIPFYQTGSVLRYEHSMGAGMNNIPAHILRGASENARKASAS